MSQQRGGKNPHRTGNAKINRNFEVFSPTNFLATITQHIPDKGA